ncbi:thermonuclease family protein [Pollutimonas subterranea]|nr:thermonuclease family protein [Pollutimonas subterranea]
MNKLTSRLLAGPTAKPWTRWLAVALMLGLAGLGSVTAFTPKTSADTASSTLPVDGNYTMVGRVVQVIDGDTFTLLVKGQQQRVRMASIDAPEIGGNPDRPGQAHGQASKKALTALIAGQTITLDCYERDRYDRNVCNVPLPGGDTANRKQVAAGMAWANMEGRGKFMRDPELPGLEQQARRAGAGVWQQARPVSPWAWRYQCWKQGQC